MDLDFMRHVWNGNLIKIYLKKPSIVKSEVLDFLKNKLESSKYSEFTLHSLKIKASQYRWMHNRIYYIRNSVMLHIPTIAERKLLVIE